MDVLAPGEVEPACVGGGRCVDGDEAHIAVGGEHQAKLVGARFVFQVSERFGGRGPGDDIRFGAAAYRRAEPCGIGFCTRGGIGPGVIVLGFDRAHCGERILDREIECIPGGPDARIIAIPVGIGHHAFLVDGGIQTAFCGQCIDRIKVHEVVHAGVYDRERHAEELAVQWFGDTYFGQGWPPDGRILHVIGKE